MNRSRTEGHPAAGVHRTILGSGGLYAIGTAAPILSSLIVTPLVTRMLGPEQYGVVGVGISLYQMLLVLLAFGLPSSITRHALIERSGRSGASGLVVYGATGAVIVAVLAALTLPLWGTFVLSHGSIWTLVWPIISAVGLAIVMLAQSYLRAVDRVLAFVVIGGLAAIIPPVLGVLSISTIDASATRYLSSLAIGHLMVGLGGLIFVVILTRPTFSRADLRLGLAIGLPTVPHQVAGALLSTVLVITASHLGGIESAGQMQLAVLLGTAPLVIIGAVNNSWAPLIYRAAEKDRRSLLSKSTALVSTLCLFLVSGYCAVAPLLVEFIGGSAIASETLVQASTIAAGSAAFMVWYLSNIHMVFLTGRTGPLAATTPISLVIAVGTALTLANATGAFDLRLVAVGIPVFHLLQALMSIFLRRRTGLPGADLRPSVVALVVTLGVAVTCSLAPVPLLARVSGFILIAAVAIVFGIREYRAVDRRIA